MEFLTTQKWEFFFMMLKVVNTSPKNNPFCQLYLITTFGVVYYHHDPPGLTEDRYIYLVEFLSLLRYDTVELQETGGGAECKLQKLQNGIEVFHYVG